MAYLYVCKRYRMYDAWSIYLSGSVRRRRICDIYPNYMSAIVTPRVIQILFVYQYALLDVRCVRYMAYLRIYQRHGL